MKNGILLFILLVLVACGEKKSRMEKKEVKVLQYDCTNAYTIEFSHTKTIIDKEDSTETNELTVKHNGKTEKFELVQIPAGSGVKYKTKKENFIYWEHQGESIFGTEDSTFCSCK